MSKKNLSGTFKGKKLLEEILKDNLRISAELKYLIAILNLVCQQ